MMRSRMVAAGLLLAATGAGAAPGDWPAYGGAPGGGQHSALAQITPANVGRLHIAWAFRTGEMGRGLPDPERRRFEANPLVVDGRMYLATGTGIVFALDPASGRLLWRFDARIRRDRHFSDPASRGVSYWRDPQAAAGAPCAARILFGTLDARLIALDAATGTPCAGFGEAGTVDLRRGIALRDADGPWGNYAVTSPPVIADGVAVVGSSIGDNRAHAEEQGVVRGYDVRSGRELWRWDPVPRDPVAAVAQGWRPEQAATVGAANAWAPLSADPALGLVYVPTGSASPDYYGGERLGGNRDADSLVALDLHSGRRVWARQLVHHDLWDYDLASQPALATLQTAQGPRQAVLQATKTGFLFAFDRRDGRPLFPIEEVPVPASDVPGEHAAPTQPMPEPALRLARHDRLTPADAWGPTPGERRECERLIAGLRSEGIFTPPSVRGTVAWPGWAGGVNWGGIAVDPQRQLAIVPVTELPMQVALIPRERFDGNARRDFPRTGVQPHGRHALRHAPRHVELFERDPVRAAAVGQAGRGRPADTARGLGAPARDAGGNPALVAAGGGIAAARRRGDHRRRADLRLGLRRCAPVRARHRHRHDPVGRQAAGGRQRHAVGLCRRRPAVRGHRRRRTRGPEPDGRLRRRLHAGRRGPRGGVPAWPGGADGHPGRRRRAAAGPVRLGRALAVASASARLIPALTDVRMPRAWGRARIANRSGVAASGSGVSRAGRRRLRHAAGEAARRPPTGPDASPRGCPPWPLACR